MERWLPKLRFAAAAVCFVASGGLAAWVLVERVEPGVARAAVGPTAVVVGSVDVPKGLDAAAFARELAEGWEGEAFTLEVPGSDSVTRTRAGFGASVDTEALAAAVEQAADTTSAMRRMHAGTRRNRLSLPSPVEVGESETIDLLSRVADSYNQRASDARLDLRTGEVRPHQHGRRLDVHRTLDAMLDAFATGASSARAVVEERRARRTTEALAGIDVSHPLGTYETRYSAAAESRDRTFNVRVAAGKIDGLVVMPGETFDFNDVVGERSEANGFRPAPVIAGGELVDGVGGGTCQVAGTLHAAVFFAGLLIVERSPHSRPSTYIFMGLDAVVSYPQLNFRFRNDLPTPVAIGMTVEGGVVRAEIRGAALERLVTHVRRVDEVAPYAESRVDDSSLPRGVRVLRQRGVPGFTVTNFRIIRDLTANQATRTSSSDSYPPTTQIWRVGTGGQRPAAYAPPEGDTHGEYTADEYLELTQGTGVPGTSIGRRAGRSGAAGWTERMGFPQP